MQVSSCTFLPPRPPLMRAVIDAVFGAGSDALTFP